MMGGIDRTFDTRPLAWLDQHSPDGSATGLPAPGWESSVWIVHAMYETDELPGDISWNDLKLHPALREGLPPGMDKTSGHGWSETPKAGWRRVWWAELGKRRDIDPFAGLADEYSFAYLDTHDVFNLGGSWPINNVPPAEGSLDPAQYVRPVEHLIAAATPPDSPCLAYYNVLAVTAFVEGFDPFASADSQLLFRGTTHDLATQVVGSAALIERIARDPEIETVASLTP